MEVYIPYIVGSSVSALIGKYAYNYIYSESESVVKSESESVVKSESESVVKSESESQSVVKDIVKKNTIKQTIDYNLLDNKLNETKVTSDISNNAKIQKLKQILMNECNRTIHSDFKKKNVRRKWINMVREYETIGHNSFVEKWNKP